MKVKHILPLLIFVSACTSNEEGTMGCDNFTVSSRIIAEDFCQETVTYEFVTTEGELTQWDFGDGASATGSIVEHEFEVGEWRVDALAEGPCPARTIVITNALDEFDFTAELLLTPPPYLVNSTINLNQSELSADDFVIITDPAGNVTQFSGDEVPDSFSLENTGDVWIDIIYCMGSDNERSFVQTIVVQEEIENGQLSFSQAVVDSYIISTLPLPDKVDVYLEIEIDEVVMHRTITYVWDGSGVTAAVPADLVLGNNTLSGFTANSILTLRIIVDGRLFAEHNFTDIINLNQFGPFSDANGNTSFNDLEFGNNNQRYSIRFSSFN